MGELKVYQVTETEGTADAVGVQKTLDLLQTISGDQGPGWKRAVAPLNYVRNKNFYLSLHAIVGNGYLSDFAVDALELLQGQEVCKEAFKSTADFNEKRMTPRMTPASCYQRCFSNATSIAEEYG